MSSLGVCARVRDGVFVFVCVCVTVCTSDLFELPGDAGRLELPIARTVPHPDGGLTLEHFGAQLRHRVETDLLLGCVFKVLGQKKDPVMWLLCNESAFVHFFGEQLRD